MMKSLKRLESVVCNEVDMISKAGKVSPTDWENLGMAVDILKDIATIESMINFDEESSDYSASSSMDDTTYQKSSENTYTVQMLEEKLNRTSDPVKRDHLMQTINMLKFER